MWFNQTTIRGTCSEVPEQLFALAERVQRIVRAFKTYNEEYGEPDSRVVIDALRSPLEMIYMREQFASFFSMAITAPDEDRKARLTDLNLSKSEIEKIDKKEYDDQKKHLNNYDSFTSQNIQDCLQSADIVISNSGRSNDRLQGLRRLASSLVRYVSLILRPGIVTPTRDERCMQIAFAAKLNSGCISRQVGAVVADRNHSIKAVGWNDVPKGQVPCKLRDVDSLLGSTDLSSFSKFEQSSSTLLQHLRSEFQNRAQVSGAQGLPCPYCFKDAFNKIEGTKNQVHTRSLHAEENAFLQLAKFGNTAIEGGVLYTTASPCELCSKKAFQLGIRDVVFIDPYPGISEQHVLGYTQVDERPRLRLFSGAVGVAYHRLYSPLLSVKDELARRLEGVEIQPKIL